jgi:hypothetical protein
MLSFCFGLLPLVSRVRKSMRVSVVIDLCDDEKAVAEALALTQRQSTFILNHFKKSGPLKMKFVKENLKLLGMLLEMM